MKYNHMLLLSEVSWVLPLPQAISSSSKSSLCCGGCPWWVGRGRRCRSRGWGWTSSWGTHPCSRCSGMGSRSSWWSRDSKSKMACNNWCNSFSRSYCGSCRASRRSKGRYILPMRDGTSCQHLSLSPSEDSSPLSHPDHRNRDQGRTKHLTCHTAEKQILPCLDFETCCFCLDCRMNQSVLRRTENKTSPSSL